MAHKPNITSGRDARTVSAVLGLPELKKAVAKMKTATVSQQAQDAVGSAAFHAYTEIRHSAMGAGVPHEVFEDIFLYSKLPPGQKRVKVSALTGVRKRGRSQPWARAYAEWYPGRRAAAGRLKRAKKSKTLMIPGAMSRTQAGQKQKIGENLATMWELGTNIMAARPWFRPAIERARARVMTMLAAGYKAIIERQVA